VGSVAAVDASTRRTPSSLRLTGGIREGRGRAVDTDFSTHEFAALDGDGNLITFFHRT
jgi:hypothetical protein